MKFRRGQFSCLLFVQVDWRGIGTDSCCNCWAYLLDVFGRPGGPVKSTSSFLRSSVLSCTGLELSTEPDNKR